MLLEQVALVFWWASLNGLEIMSASSWNCLTSSHFPSSGPCSSSKIVFLSIVKKKKKKTSSALNLNYYPTQIHGRASVRGVEDGAWRLLANQHPVLVISHLCCLGKMVWNSHQEELMWLQCPKIKAWQLKRATNIGMTMSIKHLI